MSKLSKEFTKDESLELMLSRLNESIEPIKIGTAEPPKLPLMLLFGCPRSGTTLFMQWIASLGVFGYPSNLIARFFGNPSFGCEIQKALIDLDKGNQLDLTRATTGFESSLGRTHGALAPSEFWYYWRRFFQFTDSNKLSEVELGKVDTAAFVNGLGAMEGSIGKPLVLKGMIMNWHIPFLSRLSEQIFSVSVRRDMFDVAQSVLLARERYSGGRDVWWSFKPPQYRDWLELSPIEQVAAQVVYTQSAVEAGMSEVDSSRKLEVEFDEFCADPRRVYKSICERYQALGYELSPAYEGVQYFETRSEVRLNSEDAHALKEALSRFKSTCS